MKFVKMPFWSRKNSVSYKMGKVHVRLLWNVFVFLVVLGLVHGMVVDRRKLMDAKAAATKSEQAAVELQATLNKAMDELNVAKTELAEVKKQLQKKDSSVEKKKEEPKKEEPPKPPEPLAVQRVEYDGQTQLTLHLSAPADEEVLREYIKVSEVNGAVGLKFAGGTWRPRVEVSGDFPFCKPITLRVRAGFPARKDANRPPLVEDFTYKFTRSNARPEVIFADKGRYLPPDGKRLMAISSINVTNLLCSVARVPAANIVQLLAREEEVYCNGNASADSRRTSELTDEPREWKAATGHRLNERRVTPLEVNAANAAPSNGVFLVTVRSADKAREDYWNSWDMSENDNYNPLRHRLVCITDIGLTVRQTDRKLHIWATSLLKGVPIAGCRICAYSPSNVRLGTATTDENGLCVVDCAGRLEPFAVVAESSDGSDVAFMALRGRMEVEETGVAELARELYLEPDACAAFAWTERGIYRHGEKIFFHAILRNGKGVAPKPFPVVARLVDPEDRVEATCNLMPDELGAVLCEGFSVGEDRPSGAWKILVTTPGKTYETLGRVDFSVEEFVPPQIRVKVAPLGDSPISFGFAVSAEHLFGGPARNLRAEGAVVFKDAPFEPPAWKGYKFGDGRRGLKPNFRNLAKARLDENGRAVFSAAIQKDTGLPQAAVRAVGQGTVFEDGGRPATARAEKLLHFYPHYIGVKIGGMVRVPENGFPSVSVACVTPDGKRLDAARRLEVSFSRMENVYSCRTDDEGWNTWHCDHVLIPCSETITLETKADADVPLSIPFRDGGDYVLSLRDPESDVGFSASFWLSTWGDETVRAPMANPAAITVTPDKNFYRPGERPRLVVKSPFTGHALVQVVREDMIYCESFAMTNATAEIVLPAAAVDWAPNADVSVAVVRGSDIGTARQSVRAHGAACLKVRPIEREIPVKLSSSVVCGNDSGSVVTANVEAVSSSATGVVAVVTVVDEGINILTGQETPDPIGFFAQARMGIHPLWDLFDRLLPVWDGDPLKVRGVKTGGGADDELLGRISPVPSRRFKPLAMWRAAVPLTNGVGMAVFNLPEFVGEVRVTAVAYSAVATGAASEQKKVTPKLVMQSDAPRFAAPGDAFDATLTLTDRSDRGVEALWEVSASGAVKLAKDAVGKAVLAKEGSTNITIRVEVGNVPGQGRIRFRATGSGETHEQTIEIPVRPAVAARETAGAECLPPGKSRTFPALTSGMAEAVVRTFAPATSPLAQLSGALTWLADYPHGCLEQTSSRIFPLVAAGGLLNTLTASADKGASDRKVYVDAGVKRVSSMIRYNDFAMWPDCNYSPHDPEVSLYASHFLIAAELSGSRLEPKSKDRVMGFLRKWALGTNTTVSAYACHTLALAGAPDRDRMIRLYDGRAKLNLLSRARLARAFAKLGDRARAAELVKSGADAPASVKEAAFAVLALLDIDPADPRLARLVQWLASKRDAARFSWGTTEGNAHALIALASYYRHHPFKEGKPELTIAIGDKAAKPIPEKTKRTVKGGGEVAISNAGAGDAWFTWRQIEIPQPEAVTNESSHIAITRCYLTAEGKDADLATVARGDLLIAQLSIKVDESRMLSDLVVQDLFPAALEPVHAPLDPSVYPWFKQSAHDWVMRSDARDDRMLVFSKKFYLKKGETATFSYPLRVVSSGEFIMPGPAVEAMYAPEMHSVAAPSRLVVER